MILIILTCACAFLVYFVFFKPYNYWKERRALYAKPWPFFGNMLPVLSQKQSVAEFIQYIYNRYPQQRYVGIYQFFVPVLVLRDPDLIKEIAVKEFDFFPEHRMVASKENDPIWANNLFAMQGTDQWKNVQAIVTPTFTSSKLKGMFEFFTECAKQFTDHFLKQGDFITLEMKDAFRKVTNDVIASTAFGIRCNSMENPNNEIFTMGKNVSSLDSGLKGLKLFIASVSPMLIKFFKIRFFDEDTSNFFKNIITETIKFREENGIFRQDVIHLMIEARKEQRQNCVLTDAQELGLDQTGKLSKTEITDDLITAQAVLFFLAGFDTTSTAMSFTAYELAINPVIQERLQAEVDETLETCNEKVTYEALMGMNYLDMVVSESLRKWPPFPGTDRKLIKPYTVQPKAAGESPLHLSGDVICQIPIIGIHRDPTFFPDPEKFDPERFSDENKHKIKPFSYIPFGVGPRGCIGSRFALLELKTVIFHLLSEFEIVAVKETPIPLLLSKTSVNPFPEGGFWLGLKRRSAAD